MQFISILVSATLSAASMPMIIGFAESNKLYDGVGGRKIHSGNVPRLGGIGIFLAFFIACLAYPLVSEAGLGESFLARYPLLIPVAIGAFIVHAIGLLDDFHGMRAIIKLGAQIAAALVVVASGLGFQGLGFAPDFLAGSMRWASILITCFWIVGVTNAMNLIDGMDGLAGGISLIASLAYAAFYYLAGDAPSSFICLSLAGAIAGFLTVNFPAPRAKIFMGDSGSLFLGFMLSVMPFLGMTGGQTGRAVGVVPASLVLFIPIFDTLRAIWRRRRAGVSVATPDRLHLHHLFYDAGYKPIAILAIVYGVTLIQAVTFLVSSRMPPAFGFFAELIIFCCSGIMFRYASALSPKKM
jgi:UDP-GlcNAc:undecaprenyl-phosphate GlcNAc-1-phosphate transferase